MNPRVILRIPSLLEFFTRLKFSSISPSSRGPSYLSPRFLVPDFFLPSFWVFFFFFFFSFPEVFPPPHEGDNGDVKSTSAISSADLFPLFRSGPPLSLNLSFPMDINLDEFVISLSAFPSRVAFFGPTCALPPFFPSFFLCLSLPAFPYFFGRSINELFLPPCVPWLCFFPAPPLSDNFSSPFLSFPASSFQKFP